MLLLPWSVLQVLFLGEELSLARFWVRELPVARFWVEELPLAQFWVQAQILARFQVEELPLAQFWVQAQILAPVLLLGLAQHLCPSLCLSPVSILLFVVLVA